jgi:zinc/manganese transport system permease protein
MSMFGHSYICYALLAGTAIAIVCGLVGYFVVQRGQVFAGDALGHVAYTGAMAALVAGIDPRIGLFAATIVAGAALGSSGRKPADDVVIGSFFAWVLGLGVLMLTYYTTHAPSAGANGAANVNVLFGSILGISAAAARTAVVVAVIVAAVLLVIARPLLFATVDPAVARAAGVPVRLLGAVFLALVGATVAEASQIVGALLVLGLLAAPPAAAARLTPQPWHGFWLSAALCVASVWIGVTVSYFVPAAPASFSIMATATAIYALATLRQTLAGRTALARSA